MYEQQCINNNNSIHEQQYKNSTNLIYEEQYINRLDYMGGGLSAADQEMYRLFDEDRQIEVEYVNLELFT